MPYQFSHYSILMLSLSMLLNCKAYISQTFSDHSYGFRPGRSAHQAVAQAQQYIAEGYSWVVDLDLEKFFDRVNHDKLMGRIANRVEDKRLLKLIRAFLNAGVMENGLVSPSVEGTPQGGPLSPLLSNLVLDELDRELERRGHRFVRYADDSNIYVRSERAGQRVMESVTRFITQKLKLKVNETKSAVARPQERKFLGFSFTAGPQVNCEDSKADNLWCAVGFSHGADLLKTKLANFPVAGNCRAAGKFTTP